MAQTSFPSGTNVAAWVASWPNIGETDEFGVLVNRTDDRMKLETRWHIRTSSTFTKEQWDVIDALEAGSETGVVPNSYANVLLTPLGEFIRDGKQLLPTSDFQNGAIERHWTQHCWFFVLEDTGVPAYMRTAEPSHADRIVVSGGHDEHDGTLVLDKT